jgi:hypothetical protein
MTAMTKVQAAYFQATWNELGSPLCEHRKIDLERSEDGYVTGNYRCLACGHRSPANALSPLAANLHQPILAASYSIGSTLSRMNVATV